MHQTTKLVFYLLKLNQTLHLYLYKNMTDWLKESGSLLRCGIGSGGSNTATGQERLVFPFILRKAFGTVIPGLGTFDRVFLGLVQGPAFLSKITIISCDSKQSIFIFILNLIIHYHKFANFEFHTKTTSKILRTVFFPFALFVCGTFPITPPKPCLTPLCVSDFFKTLNACLFSGSWFLSLQMSLFKFFNWFSLSFNSQQKYLIHTGIKLLSGPCFKYICSNHFIYSKCGAKGSSPSYIALVKQFLIELVFYLVLESNPAHQMYLRYSLFSINNIKLNKMRQLYGS
ncbi:hypothetical protein AGLY_014575 [Aphis glycines]|uniref:Uncharacterized protein n=1 Tax=Aphis glycines TaxID=307491 RepID=A0A6G0T5H0_APHGL|nr:hypothetical protein AGLY_014575 [Aphis glycines]